MDFLAAFGATPTRTRVCVDRNRVTGGGVTAGIDFALTLVSILVDRKTAEAIQLRLEYNPAPPFNSGSPDTAPPEILALHEGEDRAGAGPPHRGDPSRRRAAGQRRSGGVTAFDRTNEPQQKKAARFPERPFLSYGSSTLTGDFRRSAPGAYLPATS